MKQSFIGIALIYFLLGCQETSTPSISNHLFADSPLSVPLVSGIIDEASGLADSKANAGLLWVEQDSGNPPELALLAYNGSFKKKIFIKGAVNRDWEDLALAKGPDASLNYIYLADIGDNSLQYNNYFIYRFPEPAVSVDSVLAWEKITFQYPDGPHNAEAIFVDDSSKAIYIFTKSDLKSKIFRLAYPQNSTGVITATLVGELPFGEAVGAAISPNGREMIIKTYTALNYWSRQTGESIETALKRSPTNLSYKLEIQGEAVCFKNDNSGFYTLSEKPAISTFVELNFYKRN